MRLLLNFASQGPPDVSLLLVGGPGGLASTPPWPARPPDGALPARAACRRPKRPPTSSAGSPRPAPPALFSRADALAALHRAADGLPRRLNRLADLALLIAYAEGLPRPDARAVAIAAREADLDALAA